MRLICFLLFTTILQCCSRSRPQDQWITVYGGNALLAWNEDTVNSYQVLFKKHNRFSYTVEKNVGSQKTTSYYSGKFCITGDTIALKFTGNRKPQELRDFFLFEASGHYLVQWFSDTSQRLFLRWQHSNR